MSPRCLQCGPLDNGLKNMMTNEFSDVTAMPARSAAFEAKRMDLLRQVALVFAEDGYHQTSVNSLAARLRVSKPVLYYYARNKDDLLYQCGEVARQELQEVMDSTHRIQMSGVGKLRRFFTKYAEIMGGDFGRCLVLVDHRGLSQEARERDVLARREVEEAVCRIIREGQKDGSIVRCNPVLAARALFGAFNGIPRWFQKGKELNASDVADAYLDLFLTGMGTRLAARDLSAPLITSV
jgi:TetR/AcrR family transcriptional regulator, cholesterol catabolism regulator